MAASWEVGSGVLRISTSPAVPCPGLLFSLHVRELEIDSLSVKTDLVYGFSGMVADCLMLESSSRGCLSCLPSSSMFGHEINDKKIASVLGKI